MIEKIKNQPSILLPISATFFGFLTIISCMISFMLPFPNGLIMIAISIGVYFAAMLLIGCIILILDQIY
jgi:hypothetical protein